MDEHRKLYKNFDRISSTYDSYASVQKKASVFLTKLASPHLSALSESSALLDIGSGTGNVFQSALPFLRKDFSLFYLDVSRAMLRQSKKTVLFSSFFRKIPCSFVQARMEDPPFQENTFDVIFSSFALHWSRNLEKTFASIKKILKKDGKVFLCLICHGSLYEIESCFYEKEKKKIKKINDFYHIAQYIQQIKENQMEIISISLDEVREQFPSISSAIRHLKFFGTQTSHTPKGHLRLKNLEQNHQKKFGYKHAKITWCLAYFQIENKL